jgi:hypothetical protein
MGLALSCALEGGWAMNAFKVINAAGVAILLAACSRASSPRPASSADSANTDEAFAANAVSTSAAASTVASPASQPLTPEMQARLSEYKPKPMVEVPDDVRRDPLQLAPLMQQMRAQIVYKTKKIKEPEYEQIVRPSVASQLRGAGFDDGDVQQILAGVDYSRKIEGYR